MPGDQEPRAVTQDWHGPCELCSTSHRVFHKDDIPWHKVPLPRRWHRCTAQTSGVVHGRWVERCACGAIRYWPPSQRFRFPWQKRNSRRKRRG